MNGITVAPCSAIIDISLSRRQSGRLGFISALGDDFLQDHAERLGPGRGRDDGACAGVQGVGEPARLGPGRADDHAGLREHVADLFEALEREARPVHLVEQDQVGAQRLRPAPMRAWPWQWRTMSTPGTDARLRVMASRAGPLSAISATEIMTPPVRRS